jgi:hypothetical protein
LAIGDPELLCKEEKKIERFTGTRAFTLCLFEEIMGII